MHRLLKRQLSRNFGKDFDISSLDEKLVKFLDDIEDSYNQYEEDQKINESILKVNSDELYEKNKSLREFNATLELKISEATLKVNEQNKKLSESVNNFQNVLDTTMEMIVLSDEDQNIIDINKSGLEMIGFSCKSDIIGTNLLEYVLESELAKLKTAIAQDIV